MADRRSLFSRFWPASASRRTPSSQTTAPSRTITNSTPTAKSQPVRQSTTTGSSPPTSTTPPTTEPQKADQPSSESTTLPSGEVQIASQPTTTSSANRVDEPKTTSPPHATTQSPSSLKPASPYRQSAQSRSPPPPSSPSHAPPQAGRMGSQAPPTPERASQPRSPSRLTSRSPKQGSSSSPKGTQPTSPSKESRQPTKEISSSYDAPILASNEKDPKPAVSQREPQLKAEVRSDVANGSNGKSVDGASFKHDQVEVPPSQSSELGTTTTPAQGLETPAPRKSLDSSTINGGNKPLIEENAKPEETKDMKEVVQATNSEANEEKKKEVDDSMAPRFGSEAQIIDKAEVTSKPDQMHREKQEILHKEEILATSLPGVTPANTTTSEPKKRSAIASTHNQSSLSNGEHVPLYKNVRDEMSKFVNQMANGDPKRAIYDKPVSVITLAGENKGASMQMESNPSKREAPIHIHRSYKINADESGEATTDGEGSSEGKKSEDTEDQPTEAYVNNNAQGINNSIVFNSSITEGNPGVHMVVTHVPKETIQPTDKTSPPQTQKAEFNMARTEKLTYQPTVRRRCLRGLFSEPSDSDPENPEKPRRHGCRVGCQKSDKENNIDVLQA